MGRARIRAVPRPRSRTLWIVSEETVLAQRIPLSLLAVLCPVVLVSLLLGDVPGVTWSFALTAAVFPAALIALAGGRRAGRVAVVLAVMLAGGAVLMLALAGGGRIGGLPGSAWAMFGALWAWPLIVTVWAYAASFRVDGQAPPSPPEGGGA